VGAPVKPALRPPTILELPGQLTPTSWTPSTPLSFDEWVEKLALLARIGGAVQWWVADCLNWGAQHFGERAAQGFAQLDALYAEQTQLNLAYVGRVFPKERRRDLPLTFAHHAAVAALDPATQDYWLDQATAGESLPNGERKLWSVRKLRDALKADREAPAGCAHVCPWHPKAEAP